MNRELLTLFTIWIYQITTDYHLTDLKFTEAKLADAKLIIINVVSSLGQREDLSAQHHQ